MELEESVYGYCPLCGARGITRERRPNGNDACENGHTYPSAKALEEKRVSVEDELQSKYYDLLRRVKEAVGEMTGIMHEKALNTGMFSDGYATGIAVFIDRIHKYLPKELENK